MNLKSTKHVYTHHILFSTGYEVRTQVRKALKVPNHVPDSAQVKIPYRRSLQYIQQKLHRDHIWVLCTYLNRQAEICIGNGNQVFNSTSESLLISDQGISLELEHWAAYISCLLA